MKKTVLSKYYVSDGKDFLLPESFEVVRVLQQTKNGRVPLLIRHKPTTQGRYRKFRIVKLGKEFEEQGYVYLGVSTGVTECMVFIRKDPTKEEALKQEFREKFGQLLNRTDMLAEILIGKRPEILGKTGEQIQRDNERFEAKLEQLRVSGGVAALLRKLGHAE